MAWENSENLDFPWKYHKYPHIFCPASLVKFGEKWDTLMVIFIPGGQLCLQLFMVLVEMVLVAEMFGGIRLYLLMVIIG